MNRRVFVAQTAAAALSLKAAEPRIRIAFLGGAHSHALPKARIILESPEYEMAGVWEADAATLGQFTKLGAKSISREEALADKSISAIAVESAVKDHAEHARLALEAGKHVHVEKPPADTLERMRKLVQLAGQRKLLLQSGYMWRYNHAINKALEAAREGWLGDVYMVRGMMSTLIDAKRRLEWAMFAGGQMFEQGAHLIDIVVRLLGRPDSVTPFLRKHGPYNDSLKDNTVAIFEYPKTLAIIQSSTLQPGAGDHRCLEIQGTNGTATVRPIETTMLQIHLAKAAGPYRSGMQTLNLPQYRRYADDLAEFAAAIRGLKPLSVTLEQELLVQETVLWASGMHAG